MKPTYYKLNREKAEELLPNGNINDVTFKTLEGVGILEEVQEEEKPEWLVMKNGRYRFVGKTVEFEITNGKLEITNTKEDYSAIDAAADEFEKACNNMFGNPLEQVDSMIEGTMKMKNNCTCSGVLLEHCLTKPVYNHHKNCNL